MKTLSLNFFSKPTKCSFKSLLCNMRPSDPPPRCVAYMCQVKKKKKKSAPAQASPSGTRTVTGASLEHFEAIVWQWLLTWDPRPTGKLPPEGPFRGQLFKLSTITLLSPSRFVQPLSAAHRKACEESGVTFLNCYSRTVACCVLLKKKTHPLPALRAFWAAAKCVKMVLERYFFFFFAQATHKFSSNHDGLCGSDPSYLVTSLCQQVVFTMQGCRLVGTLRVRVSRWVIMRRCYEQ